MSYEKLKLEEEILSDDYPVYFGYSYVADGKVVRSELMDGDVSMLRKYLESRGISAKTITTCDIFGRQKLNK